MMAAPLGREPLVSRALGASGASTSSHDARGDESCASRYCRCTGPCFEFMKSLPWLGVPDFKVGRGRRAAQRPSELQGNFPELLRNGQLFTSLILATNFSEKYRGREMAAQDTADVRLPCGMGHWSITLIARSGYREATGFIWLGDSVAGDDTLYVAFGPLRNKTQFWKLLSQGTHLLNDEVEERDGARWSLNISSYVKEKLDHLWDPLNPDYDFGNKLLKAASDYPDHRIIFSGISHGATLAQASALRFGLKEPVHRNRIFVPCWNAYKWTDKEGSALAQQIFCDRSAPMVLSSRPLIMPLHRQDERIWDSVSEFPPGFSPLPGSLLLDIESGQFFDNSQAKEAHIGIDFALRMAHLHFAKAAITAIKAAMVRVPGVPGSASTSINDEGAPAHLDLYNDDGSVRGSDEESVQPVDVVSQRMSKKERLNTGMLDGGESPVSSAAAWKQVS